MYSAPYGYGNAAGQAFTGAPPGQSPQMQPGPGQNQPQQQMMYNQQFSMGQSVPGGYAGAQNPGAMMPGAGGGGPAGMMQNTAMPQMPANGQSEFIRSLVSPARVTRSDRPKLLLCLRSPIPSLSYVQSQSRSSSMGRRVSQPVAAATAGMANRSVRPRLDKEVAILSHTHARRQIVVTTSYD